MTIERGISPFGEVSCEREVSKLHNDYGAYFFNQAAFNEEALQPHIYVIVGRRGSGKSSLGQYFALQQDRKGAKFKIIWDKDGENKHASDLFANVFEPIMRSTQASKSFEEVAIHKYAKVWQVVIWSLLYDAYRELDPCIERAHQISSLDSMIAIIKRTVKAWFEKYGNDKDNSIVENLEKCLTGTIIKEAQEAVLRHAQKTPIIIALDTLERYSVEKDTPMLKVIAALVQVASDFQDLYVQHGVQVKVFLASEVFLHVKERAISNTLKNISGDTLYLHWRPRSLLRLICWRFYKHLRSKDMLLEISRGKIDWDSYDDVLEKMWVPYFGYTIRNGHGIEEESFPYVLRHTQLRPRQLVMLCNSIAEESKKGFPLFSSDVIRKTVQRVECELANEVFNSYEMIYPNVMRALKWAFHSFPISFQGKKLGEILPKFVGEWSDKTYTLSKFMELVAELGIVGRVQNGGDTQRTDSSQIIEAEFEYSRQGRLDLHEHDDCVIHPMFFHTLKIDISGKNLVYPFLPHDYPEYKFYGFTRLERVRNTAVQENVAKTVPHIGAEVRDESSNDTFN